MGFLADPRRSILSNRNRARGSGPTLWRFQRVRCARAERLLASSGCAASMLGSAATAGAGVARRTGSGLMRRVLSGVPARAGGYAVPSPSGEA